MYSLPLFTHTPASDSWHNLWHSLISCILYISHLSWMACLIKTSQLAHSHSLFSYDLLPFYAILKLLGTRVGRLPGFHLPPYFFHCVNIPRAMLCLFTSGPWHDSCYKACLVQNRAKPLGPVWNVPPVLSCTVLSFPLLCFAELFFSATQCQTNASPQVMGWMNHRLDVLRMEDKEWETLTD